MTLTVAPAEEACPGRGWFGSESYLGAVGGAVGGWFTGGGGGGGAKVEEDTAAKEAAKEEEFHRMVQELLRRFPECPTETATRFLTVRPQCCSKSNPPCLKLLHTRHGGFGIAIDLSTRRYRHASPRPAPTPLSSSLLT